MRGLPSLLSSMTTNTLHGLERLWLAEISQGLSY